MVDRAAAALRFLLRTIAAADKSKARQSAFAKASAAALRAMADKMADGEDLENMYFCETNRIFLAWKTAFINQGYNGLCNKK
jgi:hypothetical protein